MRLRGFGSAGYREMSESRLVGYLAALPDIALRLGGTEAGWRIHRVPGTVASIVFIVEGPDGDLCVKQATDALHAADAELPAPTERMTFEEAALNLAARFVPGCGPSVLHYDSEQSLIVMERLTPHTPLSDALIAGDSFPGLAGTLARYLAEVLYHTSDFGMAAAEKRERVAFFCGNADALRVKEDLLFTEPYGSEARGRAGSPEVDHLVADLQADLALKRAVGALGLRFLTAQEALLHGNLGTRSILVTGTDTRIIDPAFSTFGPLGFDIGELLGHLLLGYFSQAGHDDNGGGGRDGCEAWLLETIDGVWRAFSALFLELARGDTEVGSAYPPALFGGSDGREARARALDDYLARTFQDSLGYAGITMIRCAIGALPAPELERIADPDHRARCRMRCLLLARELIKDAEFVTDIGDVTAVARQIRTGRIGGPA